jgi:hypothetical protein
MAKEDSVTITQSALADLIAASVRSEVVKIMSAKTVDERITEEMDRMRGKGRALPPETVVECTSPITHATFKARAIVSKVFPQGRVVEIYDYVRPPGCDASKEQGGLYEFPAETMRNEKGEPSKKYLFWLYKEFWQKDWNEVSGKPLSFLEQWKTPARVAA